MNIDEYTQGLRDFADWIERHPEVEKQLGTASRVLIYCRDRETFLEKLALLEGEGVPEREGRYFQVVRRFGPCEVQVYADAENVGEITTRREEVEVSDWQPHPELRTLLEAFQTVPA